MVTWLIVFGAAVGGIIFFRQKRVDSNDLNMPTPMTMLFHPIKGEGDLMVGGSIALFAFSRVILELLGIIRGVF